MSKKTGDTDDKAQSSEASIIPETLPPPETETPSTLQLTVENVHRLEQQFESTDWLYGTNRAVEAYVQDTQQSSEEDWQDGAGAQTAAAVLQINDHVWSRTAVHAVEMSSDEKHRKDSISRPSAEKCTLLSSFPECMGVHALDGRVISKVSTRTQTDWDWVYLIKNKESKQVFSQLEGSVPKPENESETQPERNINGPGSENEGEVENTQENEANSAKGRDPQILTTSQVEPAQGNFDMITMLSSSDSSGELLENELLSIPCEHCLQPRKPKVTRAELENNTDPEELFCCEVAWRMAEFLLEEEEKAFAAIEEGMKIDVGPHPPFIKAAKERAEQRLKEWESLRTQSSVYRNRFLFDKQRNRAVSKNTVCYRLSNLEVWKQEDTQLLEMEISPPDRLTLPGQEPGEKSRNILMKLYSSGQTFITIFPDGTGQVFYPSGRIAILISSLHTSDFTYIILEDKDIQPSIQAFFTSRGQSTVYHPNGFVCVNLTQLGGTWCSETGALRRRWSWLDHETHVHAPPFQPVNVVLSALINIRIHTQDRIYLTFTSRKSIVRFNMGTRLKLEHTKGLMLPGPDVLQRYLQMKSAEIYNLLDRIQSLITYQQSLDQRRIKPQYRFHAHIQRRKTPDKHRSPKTTRLPMGNKAT